MLPSTSGWDPSAGSASSGAECAELCRGQVTPEKPYQWGVLKKDSGECFCRMTVEQGGEF